MDLNDGVQKLLTVTQNVKQQTLSDISLQIFIWQNRFKMTVKQLFCYQRSLSTAHCYHILHKKLPPVMTSVQTDYHTDGSNFLW